MAVRTSMSDLIAQLRLFADDPSGIDSQFVDQQLQDVLDQNASLAEYEQLNPLYTIAAGGVVEYKKFMAAHVYFEADTILLNGIYETLTPATSDFKTGYFTFTTSQNLPVLIYGKWYDMNAAAADVWAMKAASLANEFDFSVDGGNYAKSKQYQQAIAIAAQFRDKALGSSGITYLRRTDVLGE